MDFPQTEIDRIERSIEGCALPAFVRFERASVDFWAIGSSGLLDLDCTLGAKLADDALRFAREHDIPRFIECVLEAIVAKGRIGAIEHSFINRISTAAYAGAFSLN